MADDDDDSEHFIRFISGHVEEDVCLLIVCIKIQFVFFLSTTVRQIVSGQKIFLGSNNYGTWNLSVFEIF